jgi:cell wall-associated NlpC family hydrolase
MCSRSTIALCLLSIGPILTGCAASGARKPAPLTAAHQAREPQLDRAAAAASIAQQQLGVRYHYGGANPSAGFDCSGLVFYSYRQAGLHVPRTSQAQYTAAQKIALADARPGDVLFFRDQTKLSHVGIYLGQRRFVHAPSSGRSVSVGRLDSPYYREHFVAVGRLVSQ